MRSETNCLFLWRGGGWARGMKTNHRCTPVSGIPHLLPLHRESANCLPKPASAFPSLQAWSRAGHTHLWVLPLLWWDLGLAITKIWKNPINMKENVPHWAECEKPATNLYQANNKQLIERKTTKRTGRGGKQEGKKDTLPVAGNDNKEKDIGENKGGWLLRYPTGLEQNTIRNELS